MKGASELADLGWDFVLEVGCEAGHPRQGGVGVAGQIGARTHSQGTEFSTGVRIPNPDRAIDSGRRQVGTVG